MRSIVLFANGIGDTVINRPALTALAKLLPKPCALICARGQHEFLLRDLDYDDILAINMTKLSDGGRKFDHASLIDKWCNLEYFVSLVPWRSNSLTSLRNHLAARINVGFDEGFDVQLTLDYSKNSVLLGFDMVYIFDNNARISDFHKPITFPEDNIDGVHHVLRSIHNIGYTNIVTIHTETDPKKKWNDALFSKTIHSILEQDANTFIIIVDYLPNLTIDRKYKDRVLSIKHLSLRAAMRFCANATCAVGIDSSMAHVADYCGVPTVTLFGPTTSVEEFGAFWSPSTPLVFASKYDESPTERLLDAVSYYCSV